jgi:hypothetical protein
MLVRRTRREPAMAEIDDLEDYLQMQFDQLDHICKSPSPWIFVCLSAFIDFLSQLEDPSEPKGSDRVIMFQRNIFLKGPP